jgi:threonine/homoserine/homoserine lactone efflux protein
MIADMHATVADAVTWGQVGPLVLAAAAIMGSPGPATVSLTATGAAHGVRASLAYLAGIVAGTFVVLLAVGTGITTALLAVPALRSALLVVSALYILRLAYAIATAPPLREREPGAPRPTARGGLLLGVANPKAWVAIAAVFASVTIARAAALDGLLKVAVLTGMIVVINAAWLAAGASLAPLLRRPRASRIANVVMAAALVGAAALALSSG